MSGADYHGPGNVRPVPNGAISYLSPDHETSEEQILAQVVQWIADPKLPDNAIPASPDDVLWLLVHLERVTRERDLVYGELNRVLGGNAPQAWDRIKAALDA